jgi:multidrug efflux pump subunit AcrA (membrane-fusion protein)
LIALSETDPDRMRPGMSVMAEVLPRPREDVLLVPRGAVDFTGEAPRVRLASGDLADVELGPCDATRCVVESGLEEGQRVGIAG